ncbi:hypothetical protein [Alkalinema sp. FACHB-956]|uniref:hypothetical protein n=1 Tax=Alkalinema sp. FACHB-956 TaxID=2692768 RepID=UPI001687C6C0|nr:hypothetical protein [Alkalinema sp. FACHB-956]MBD2326906.1 hypothetical protein [Alkalinema sp. FACHB-956]
MADLGAASNLALELGCTSLDCIEQPTSQPKTPIAPSLTNPRDRVHTCGTPIRL